MKAKVSNKYSKVFVKYFNYQYYRTMIFEYCFSIVLKENYGNDLSNLMSTLNRNFY